MSLELSEPLQRALDSQPNQPLRVVDPRTQKSYFLISAEEYQSLSLLLEEEQRQRAIHAAGLRNAVGRMRDEGECESVSDASQKRLHQNASAKRR
jgi:hypothetical protein